MAETVRTFTELELEDKEEKIEFAADSMKSEMTMKKGEDVVFTIPFKATLAKKPTVTWLFKSSELKISEKVGFELYFFQIFTLIFLCFI